MKEKENCFKRICLLSEEQRIPNFRSLQKVVIGFKPTWYIFSFFFCCFEKNIEKLKTEINKFVSSANILDVTLVELPKSSFICMNNKSGTDMEPCVTPHRILL